MCDTALPPRYNTMTDSPQSDPPVLILDWKVIMKESDRRGVEEREKKRCSGRGVKVASHCFRGKKGNGGRGINLPLSQIGPVMEWLEPEYHG